MPKSKSLDRAGDGKGDARPSALAVERGPKPVISKEAKGRIRGFVKAVQALQKEYGVELATQDDATVFRDMHRVDNWQGYGKWDAFIYNGRPLRARNLAFEDFSCWGK